MIFYRSYGLRLYARLRATALRSVPRFIPLKYVIPSPVTHVQYTRIAHLARTRTLPARASSPARLWENTAGVMRDREQPRITIHIIQQ